MANAKVQVRRAYEDAAEDDGTRVLVGSTSGARRSHRRLSCVSGMATIRSASANSAAATRRNWQSMNGPARWRTCASLRGAGE